jgi:2-phosphoglycerate kinase
VKTSKKTSLVYWIGGSTCAGKTTISNILAANYGLTVYHCDEYLGKHIKNSNAQEHPNLHKKFSFNDILNMKVEEYLSWSMDVFSEEFEMILEDLDKLSDGKPILVEGVNLLPKLIKDEITDTNHAVWLVANEVFYKKHQIQRNEMFERIKECSNHEQALNNYMSDDLAFGKQILNDTKSLDLKVIEVEDESDFMKYVEDISSYFNFFNMTGN